MGMYACACKAFCTHGEGKKGFFSSQFGLSLAYEALTGEPWAGRRVTQGGSALSGVFMPSLYYL